MSLFNAIRVGEIVEKVQIDFTDLDSLESSSGFKRLYLIHTAKTIELGKKVGFHVGGFCDDYGEGGPSLAAKTAGYPSLPSDLILCAMDDEYNYLPLNSRQLETLYLYLTKGITSPEIDGEDGDSLLFEALYSSASAIKNDDSQFAAFEKKETKTEVPQGKMPVLPLLIFEVEAHWPNSPDDYHYSSANVWDDIYDNYPDAMNFIYFDDLVRDIRYITMNDTIEFEVVKGDERITYILKENESATIEFDYTPNQPTSRRVGKATLTHREVYSEDNCPPGKIEFRMLYLSNGEPLLDNSTYMTDLNTDPDSGSTVEPGDKQAYGLLYFDLERRLAILYSFSAVNEDSSLIYFPLDLDKGFTRKETITDENGNKIDQILEVVYHEE